MTINTIDDVIATLELIIQESETNDSTQGYFAALYLKVTRQVKAGIIAGDFQDNARMEQLDVTFAKRYIDAYFAHQQGKAISQSWQAAFAMADRYWPIVIQHLLSGMNAHINLDLGIASAEVMKGQDIQGLHTDFNRINTILAGLVNQVQQELAAIWPTLHWILRKTNRINKFLTDFSMEAARDGAWRFASTLAHTPNDQWTASIQDRDARVARNGNLISQPGWIISLALKIIRLGERGTIRQKIQGLNS
ncbi:MAG: DUF5995 family protein [Lewinella sp.]|jgi:hypothetical protein|uniref:DUF5995 family protein n=1 Tax=Lewinella sp. TaxID=2004506 RepID=UPI003D6A3D84